MTRAAILKTSAVLTLLWLTLLVGCAPRPPVLPPTPIKPRSLADLENFLLSHTPDVELFKARGPFTVVIEENRQLRLSPTERVNTDVFLAAHGERAPLAIFLHGYDSSKEAHANQANHLASWGIHALTVQLSKQGPWAGNARTLARIASLIQRSPELIDPRVDPKRIILVGHSFGALSVALALADGVPATGGILLDPAAIGKGLPNTLRKINKPLLVLGADEEIAPARNREYFFRYVRGGISEISIRGAAHEDAQYPSEFSLQHYGLDPYTTEELQVTFVSAVTAAVFSLSVKGTFDYAWASYARAVDSGKFFNPKKK